MKEKLYLLVTHQTSYFSESVEEVFDKVQKRHYPKSKVVFPNAFLIKTTDSPQDIVDNFIEADSNQGQGAQLDMFGVASNTVKEPIDFDWIVIEVEKGDMFYKPYSEGVEELLSVNK